MISRFLKIGLVVILPLMLAVLLQVLFSLPWWTTHSLCVLICLRFLGQSLRESLFYAAVAPLFLLGVLWLLEQNISAWIYFLLFVVLFALSKNAIWERVPLFLSTKQSLLHLAEILPENVRMIDLGCGTGTALFHLAKSRPDLELFGVENAYLPYMIARFRACFYPKVTIRFGNFWHHSLAEFNVVYCYLSPAPMLRVWDKFCQEAPSDAWLVSNTFEIPNQPANYCCDTEDAISSCLYIWYGHTARGKKNG